MRSLCISLGPPTVEVVYLGFIIAGQYSSEKGNIELSRNVISGWPSQANTKY